MKCDGGNAGVRYWENTGFFLQFQYPSVTFPDV